ncbi:DsbA family oxidoreductase [Phocicoccus pinnipedialis]|uniref:DSBA-like thioredoxin domain protein n=1 Tax=Phocicoccus pinnipedialis TaxID=110845 RepID=A0A6V7R012_9BACL|nr:DsbA family oxidoreductase [Jeotgalicoccus pinnipedialis]MBP1938710.1 putative DsbA family dithiol-disulfide isomerase [Jeotgalicoccus pinnipedialis]CAD2070495.1 DSBA-like thioredoxin domain protein [Jeotgalicoccus pinnipedialis]
MDVEVYLDTSCPFCYIGKRNLETALKEFGEDKFNVIYKSFELDNQAEKYPTKSLYETLAMRYNSTEEAVKENNKPLISNAKKIGITLNLDNIVPSNTRDAHRLIKYAAETGHEHDVLEALYYAHFTENKNLADFETLVEIASNNGLDANKTRVMLKDASIYTEEVIADENYAYVLGIQGVPFFIFNKTHALNGARESQHYIDAILQASGDEK